MFNKISGYIVKGVLILTVLGGALYMLVMDSIEMSLSGKHSYEYWGSK